MPGPRELNNNDDEERPTHYQFMTNTTESQQGCYSPSTACMTLVEAVCYDFLWLTDVQNATRAPQHYLVFLKRSWTKTLIEC